MFGPYRKVLRDRSAGMVFDWRRGHGSTYRLIIAFAVSAAFWGGIRGFVKVREVNPVEPEQKAIDIRVGNLDAEKNRWLAELIDRETLFQQRWDISDSTAIDRVVGEALAATAPSVYEPTLRQISLPEPEVNLANLPGMGPGALPEPDEVTSVTFATQEPNWWIEIRVVEGPDGLVPLRFPFEWPKDPGLMSEGEIWSLVLTADSSGRVIAVESWWEKANDARTGAILDKLRSVKIEPMAKNGPVRIWRLEAELVNRLDGK